MFRKTLLPVLAISMLAACGDSDGNVEDNEETVETIADVVVRSDDFSTLATAVDAAGLVETLQGEGPFTVFAPTDAAFAALPEGAIEALLADTDTLREVLLYHVLSGELLAEDVLGSRSLPTVQGASISVRADDATLNELVRITQTDVVTDNGVIHVIDAVLIPPMEAEPEPQPQTIVDIAVGNPDFSILVEAVTAAGLADALQGEGPLTVFAPTNDAFAALPGGLLEDLRGDPEALAQVLLYHVVPGDLRADDVLASEALTTLQETDISVDGGSATLNGNSSIVSTDIVASNGVIHVIDAVLVPAAQ